MQFLQLLERTPPRQKVTHEPAEDAALSKHLSKLGPALTRPENVSNRKTPHSSQLDITKTESGCKLQTEAIKLRRLER
jgi:hypothetical protein